MMEHQKIKELLSIYRELDEQERQQVEVHMQSCGECQQWWRDTQEFEQTLLQLGQQKVSYLRTQIYPSLEPITTTPRAPYALLARLALAPALVALLLIITGTLSWNHSMLFGTVPSHVTPITPAVPPQEVMTLRAAIDESLALEAEAWSQGRTDWIDRYMDLEANAAWRRAYRQRFPSNVPHAEADQYQVYLQVADLQMLNMASGILQARVRIRYGEPSAMPLLEGRFYRRVDDRWLLTSPDKVDWGTEHVWETEHFRIRYQTMDADVVQQAAHDLEIAYQTLY